VGQLLTETLILSGLGGLLGIGLSVWVLEALVRADLPLPFPITLDLSLDGTVLAFSIGISLAAGILFGLAPAIQGTNPEVAPTLRDESAGGGMGRSASLRNLLVMGQVAVSVVLLASAGLLLRSLAASSTVDPGFGTEPAGILQVVVPGTRYTEEEGRVFTEQLVERLRARPDVQAAGLIDNLLLSNVTVQTVHVAVDGLEPPPGQDYLSVDYAVIDEGFLDAAGVTLLAGRNIHEDDLEDAQGVVLVNETFGRRFFPDGNPVGRTIRLGDNEALIVGMTKDTKVRNIGEDLRPFIFRSYRQVYSSFVNIVARTSGDAGSLALEMMATAREMDPEIMVVDSRTMERHLAVQLLPRRLGAMVVAAFAILALILAGIGLYGVVSYSVARRAREVGIRLSLGAEPRSVVRMLTGGGMKLVAVGGVVGLVLSALLAQLLASLLYGVSALDPLTFVGVPVVLGLVAFLASWFPARRASRVNPVVSLKSD
jgi:putative ABC transport system permease protein